MLQFLYILANTCLFFLLVTLGSMKWYLIVVLNYISLTATDIERLFMCWPLQGSLFVSATWD